jgi:two-component system, cell cycle sensor histidine kinase and response regulator CckA
MTGIRRQEAVFVEASNQLVCVVMSQIELPSPARPPRNTRSREAFSGFIGIAAVIAAVIMSAIAILARDASEPVILIILAVLAMTGVFFLFATAAGLVRFAEEQNTESLLEAWCEADGEGVHLVSPDGWVAYTSSSFQRLLGASDMQDGRWLDRALAHVPGGNEIAYRLSQAAATRQVSSEIVRLPGRGTDESRVRLSISHVLAHDGEPFIVWRATDLDQSTAGRAMAEGEADTSHSLLASLPASAFLLTADGRMQINALLAHHLNLDSRVGLLGEAQARLTRHSVAILTDCLSQMNDGGIATIDLAFMGGDGLEIQLPIRIRAGHQGSAALGMVVEHAPGTGVGLLQPAIERFFDAAPVAIATVDADGRIGRANAAFERMFGAAAPAGAPRSLLAIVKPESADGVRRAFMQALGTLPGSDAQTGPVSGGTMRAPVDIVFGEGGRRNGRLYVSAAPGAADAASALVLYAIDTTEQSELEAQFAQAQKMQAIGELAGGIAHDFRNALMVIIGFSDLLLANHRPSDPAYADIMAIKQNATRTAGMVHQLLAFSRRQTLRPEVISIADVLSNFKATFARVLGEQYKLTVEPTVDLWPVRADATQLDHVIMNLAVNARDAMPGGGLLTIAATNVAAAEVLKGNDKGLETADYIMVRVSDTGSGMPPDVLAKIFQPFFTTKEVGKGTGLGLSMVYGIVKQTGGYIYCDSTPGTGTTFRIYLPRHDGPLIDAAALKAERKEKEKPTKDLTGTGTVLLVEDEEEVRRFAKRALERQGFTVLPAASGREALDVMAAQKAANKRIDIVVSDIVMPEMDGPTLLREIRKSQPDLRIIFMSGYAEGALDSLDDATEYSFLSKPVQMKELVEAVKDGLRRG